MKFIKYLSNAHLNYMNIAVYENGSKIKARVENVVNGKSIGAREFDSMEQLESWFYDLPGSDLGRIENAMNEISRPENL